MSDLVALTVCILLVPNDQRACHNQHESMGGQRAATSASSSATQASAEGENTPPGQHDANSIGPSFGHCKERELGFELNFS